MVSTPIYDFISSYVSSSPARFHVPGHKGAALLGPEPLDLTEVAGADDLYAPDGIIAESQRNAAALFGTAATFYSAEGSSLCIRAMLHLLLTHRPAGTPRRILAARNVHRSFISAAALLDADVSWLYPETMGSRLVPGLFFSGEIVDVDGPCGGHNLQWAWSSGYLSGISAAEYIKCSE